MTLRKTLAHTSAAYTRSERGSFGTLFALSLSVMLLATGIAMDVSRTVSAKRSMQDVADVASLAAARSVKKGNGELKKIASQVFIEHFGPDAKDMVKSVRRDGDAVTVEASDDVPTTFTRLFNRDAMEVNVASTSLYAERKMDIAMVLDTTESMSGGKMASLKRAAGELVDIIDDMENDDLRLSVMPFSQHVNVGTSRRNAQWLDVPADNVRPSEYKCWTPRELVSESNCRMEPRSRTRDGVTTYYDARVCDRQYRNLPQKCGWTKEKRQTWQGCVGSRDVPLDLQAPYNGVKIPGLLNKPCGAEILPLTSDMGSVRSSIKSLKAQGETYLPAGLMWGWRALDGSIPLANTDPAPEGDQVLVLMTDGQNTKSKNGIGHWGSDQADSDDKTRQICSSVKARKIKIYTIAYEVTDGNTRNLLESCSSGSGYYFDARSTQDLMEAFRAIGNSVRELRVAS